MPTTELDHAFSKGYKSRKGNAPAHSTILMILGIILFGISTNRVI